MAKSDQSNLKTVTLTKRHRHRGEWCEPDDKLDLRPDQIERLARRGKLKGYSADQFDKAPDVSEDAGQTDQGNGGNA